MFASHCLWNKICRGLGWGSAWALILAGASVPSVLPDQIKELTMS